MEFINKVHLRGVVGSIRESRVDGRVHYRLSLATDYCYRSNQGAVVETTWHDVSYLADSKENLDWLTKGAIAEVQGRIRHQSYVTPDSESRPAYSVCASTVKPVTEG